MRTKIKKTPASAARVGSGYGKKLRKDFTRNYELYILAIPVVAFYLYFCYKPMLGAYMAFTDYTPKGGIFGSEFVGLKHFKDFSEVCISGGC